MAVLTDTVLPKSFPNDLMPVRAGEPNDLCCCQSHAGIPKPSFALGEVRCHAKPPHSSGEQCTR